MNTDLVVVATDPAPSNALSLVQKKTDCVAFLGRGEVVLDKEGIKDAVRKAKVVLVGMSSSRERSAPELFAIAMTFGPEKRVGLYADAPGCQARSWFESVRSGVSFVSVINEKERELSRGIFPTYYTEIVACGNPDWDKYFFVKATRDEVRAKLGISRGQKVIFVSGHKDTMIAVPALAMVLQAVKILNNPDIIVVYSAHPGAALPWKEYNGAFYAGVPLKLTVRGKSSEVLAGSRFELTDLAEEEMIVGADLVIGECSTAEVGAACQRKPAIAFMTEITLGRNPEIFGRRKWEWAEAGTSIPVYGEPRALAHSISDLLESRKIWLEHYHEIQETVFPRPDWPGIALERLLDVINRNMRQS